MVWEHRNLSQRDKLFLKVKNPDVQTNINKWAVQSPDAARLDFPEEEEVLEREGLARGSGWCESSAQSLAHSRYALYVVCSCPSWWHMIVTQGTQYSSIQHSAWLRVSIQIFIFLVDKQGTLWGPLLHINGAVLCDHLKGTTWPCLVNKQTNKQSKTLPPATDGSAKVYKCIEHLLHLEHYVMVRTTVSMGWYLPSRSYILVCVCVCTEGERTDTNAITMMKEYRES